MNNINEWNINQVSLWLKQIKIKSNIIESFKNQLIDGESLIEMNKRMGKSSYDKLLKELGFETMGEILKFQKLLNQLISNIQEKEVLIENSDNDQVHYNDKLFFKIWRSKVLKLKIFYFLQKISLNYDLNFYYKEELYNYSDRDFITILEYGGTEALPKGYIPTSVEKLIFNNSIQQIIPGSIPLSVKLIIIEKNLGQVQLELGSIPTSVETLVFGNEFNQPITTVGIIPESVKTLVFGDKFNQPITTVGVIPKSCKKLKFGFFFNQTITVGIIPDSVTDLTFGYSFNQQLSIGSIPSSVVKLSCSQTPIIKSNSEVSPIPPSVREFRLVSHTNLANVSLPLGCIPFTCKKLIFDDHFNQKINPGCIPLTVNQVEFGRSFDQYLTPGSIPKSVTSLKFGWNYNKPFNSIKIIPLSVTELSFGKLFNQPLNYSIPPSVTKLSFDSYFDRSISPGEIPNSVQILEFGEQFNQSLSSYFGKNIIPPNLKILKLGNNFNQFLLKDDLPPNVKIIKEKKKN